VWFIEINRNNGANATHGPSMFRERTETMLDWRDKGKGKGKR